jgi:UDP-N-acetylmuramate dehydrogenase
LVVFVLGGGANLVFSDKGIRAVVLDTGGWTDAGCQTSDIQSVPGFSFRAGTPVDKLAVMTAERGFAGLQAFAGMPGSLGGALWMNARCYGAEMADLKPRVKLLHKDGTLETLAFDAAQWAYKKSPFQAMAGSLILEAELDLKPGERAELIEEAESHRADREKKGHYRLPSGGSAFKNNRSFGEPTGKIIDESGLRGLQVGGAQVAPWHGNIIVNTGKASAQDVRDLVMLVQDKVYKARGFLLEPELLFAGDW